MYVVLKGWGFSALKNVYESLETFSKLLGALKKCSTIMNPVFFLQRFFQNKKGKYILQISWAICFE